MAKQLLFSNQARQKMLIGLEKLARTVKATLGPSGKVVVLQKSYGSPAITKDGVTVSKEVELNDPFENMGAKMVNEVAKKTSDVAGDGTTTAVVLTEAIYREGLKNVTAGANPMALKKGIDLAVAAVVKSLEAQKKECKKREDIVAVGSVSANHDQSIGEMLADAIQKVGEDGAITIEEAKGTQTEVTFVEGLQFDKGFMSPYFITNMAKQTVEMDDPYILIFEKKISSLKELVPVLEKVAKSGRPLLLIAEDIEGEALAMLVVNKIKGVLKVAAVKAPAFGDRRKSMLEDIAIVTGGTAVTEELGLKLETVGLEHLGQAKRVILEKENTTIVDGQGGKKVIDARVAQIKSQMDATTSDYDREKLAERLAKLTGGVAIVHVSGATETAMKEKKDRVDDALHATRAAVKEGIVPGGGLAYLRAIPALDEVKAKGDQKIGVDIVRRALTAPMTQIAVNAGMDGAVIVAEAEEKKGAVGYNAATGEWVDLFKAGIIDPMMVTRSALENAASVAGLMLTTEVMVTSLEEKKGKKAGNRAAEAIV